MRIALLLAITWIIGLTEPVFTLFGEPFSWRDLILLAGGVFLIAKGTLEMHSEIEEGGVRAAAENTKGVAGATFTGVILQIAIMDIVFSIDSVVTAVGMAEHVEVMIAAIVISMAVMLIAARRVSAFIERHPTVKMLALSFLLLIGVTLVADGLGFHIPKGYVYFAFAFAIFVEALNIAVRRRRKAAAGGGTSS